MTEYGKIIMAVLEAHHGHAEDDERRDAVDALYALERMEADNKRLRGLVGQVSDVIEPLAKRHAAMVERWFHHDSIDRLELAPIAVLHANLTAEAKPEAPPSEERVDPLEVVLQLQAELAAANERAEGFKRECELIAVLLRAHVSDEMWNSFPDLLTDGATREYDALRSQRDAARQDLASAVEALRKVATAHKRNACMQAEHRPLRSPLCWVCQLDARIEESSGIVARFDAQGGGE